MNSYWHQISAGITRHNCMSIKLINAKSYTTKELFKTIINNVVKYGHIKLIYYSVQFLPQFIMCMYVTPVVSICRPCAGSSIHMPEQRSAGKCIVRASFHEHGNFYNNLAGYLILSTRDSCSFYTLRAEQSYPTFAVRLVAPLRRIMSSGEAPRTTIHLNTTGSHNSSYTKQLSFASKHLLYIFDTFYDY